MIRVMAAERQLDNAVESAMRSTLSNYNSKLAEFGIFVADPGAVENFETMLNQSLFTPDELAGYSNVSQVEVTSAQATYNSSMDILEPEVFKHQVNETMKYQAPIQTAGEFFNVLKGSKGNIKEDQAEDMKDMQEFLDKYEEVMELIKKRNAKLKEANNQVDHLLRDTHDKYNKDVVGTASGDSEKIPESIKSNMEDLTKFYPKYLQLVTELEEMNEAEVDEEQSEEEAEKQQEDKKEIEDQIEYFESAKDEFNSTSGSVGDEALALSSYEASRKDILKAMFGNGDSSSPSNNSAMDYNEEIKDLIGDDNEFKDIEKIILDDEFFTEIEGAFKNLDENIYGDGKAPTSLGDATNTKKYGLFTQATMFKLALEIEVAEGPKHILSTSKTLLKEAKKEIGKITTNWEKYKESEQMLQDDKKNEETFDEAEEDADTSFGQLLDELHTLKEMGDNFAGDQEIYDTLNTYNTKYMGSTADGEFIAEEERKDFMNQAFDKMQNLYSLLTNPFAIRDELYMNEYVMGNFGISKPYEVKQESFMYDTKQAMYIIYGHHTSGVNYGQFLLEVVLIILAVNLFDALVKNPLSKLGWVGVMLAIAGAIMDTVDDFKDFTEKEEGVEVALFGKGGGQGKAQGASVFVTPSLMTRLFLSMRSLNETFNAKKRTRIQAALSEESGVDFTTSGATYVTSNVEGKVRLLFLPTFFPGEVDGNDYVIRNEKHHNY